MLIGSAGLFFEGFSVSSVALLDSAGDPDPAGVLPGVQSAGWEPEYTNEQAFVAGTPPRPWAMVTPKRRQQLSLGALAVAVAAAVAGGIFAWRRLRR